VWKTKKGIVLLALLVGVLLAGSIAAVVAYGQTGNSTGSQPQAQVDTLLGKVAQIYQKNTGVTLDTQQLKDAFTQAQTEMRDEALQSRLNNLVAQGKITQDQADAYLKWWQAKPNTPLPGGFGPGLGGMMRRGGGHRWGGLSPPPVLPLILPARALRNALRADSPVRRMPDG
jgi:hypothetical protein